uniref:BTB domain-containing protein n=1 Tax=Denticeps clupeoides TaxID=299321 RepID=A0AAY3ZX90_9TELE
TDYMSLWIRASDKSDSSPGGGTFTLSHSLGLVARLEGLLQQGNGSDVVLQVQALGSDEAKTVRAHSLVLALQSEVFRGLLKSRDATDLVVWESAECTAVFDQFIRYLYCGEMSFSPDQAVPLLKLATKYGVWGLRQGLVQHMIRRVAGDLPVGRVAAWYEYAARAKDEALRHSCLRRLSWNLSSVLRSGEWLRFGAELLATLLRSSDLVLEKELELFEALEAWMEQQRPDGLTAETLLQSVRYAMIPPQDLFRIQRHSPVLLRHEESVRSLLYASYQFHSAPPLQLAQLLHVNCSLFTPRNYLSPAWGSPWVVGSPARDDRSITFQTQLGPSGHDAGRRVTWNALFSPRWLPLSTRTKGQPRVIVTPATSGADFAGVAFQKTLILSSGHDGTAVVRHIYNFHQSTEETTDFLAEADVDAETSEYLTDGSLHFHVVIKPLYQGLIAAKN